MQDAGRVGFVLKGEYSGSTEYEVLDVVWYGNATYAAKTTTIGNLPTDTSKWQLIVEGHDNIIEGYYDDVTGIFYRDGAHTTPIVPEVLKLYIDITDEPSLAYRWNGTYYVAIGGGMSHFVTPPTVNVGTYTYNGSAQGPTITWATPEDASYVNITNATATNAGTYTLTFALKNTHSSVWSDLTTADITYTYTIDKANGSVTVSDSSVIIPDDDDHDYIDVTISNATGDITITSEDPTIATVSPSSMTSSGGTLRIASPSQETGEINVIISVAATENYLATTATIVVTASYLPTFVTPPTVTVGTYTYNGSAQGPTITWATPEDASYVNITGATGIDAGSYTLTFSLKNSHSTAWSDSSTADITYNYTIDKANGSVTLSSTAVTIPDGDNDYIDVTISNGTGDLTIASADPTVAIVSPTTMTSSGGTLRISSPDQKTGTANVTISIAATANYSAATATIVVTASYFQMPAWATGSNADIVTAVQLADNGTIDLTEYWEVGQTRTVSLSAMTATGVGETHVAQNVEMVLMDAKNTNYEYVSGTRSGRSYASFVIGLKDGLANGTSGEYGYMNSSNTNTGSWDGCARRTWCNNVFKAAIQGIGSIFKQVKVKTAETYNGTTIKTSNDYFFLAAEREIFDTRTYSNQTEFNSLSQFEYYQTAANRIKKQGSSGSAYDWWERSPGYNNAASFCSVDSSGIVYYYSASSTNLIAPAGCV